MPGPRVRILDCESVQAGWLRQSAIAVGGKTFRTHQLEWAWNPAESTLYGFFPRAVEEAGLRPALAEATRLGAKTVGIWANAAIRVPQALKLGFETGWQPWWMTADISACTDDVDAALVTHQGLDLPDGAWQATVRQAEDWVGSGTVFIPPHGVSASAGSLAGIFDMYVEESQQRQGIGGRILRSLMQRARSEGIQALVLNSTPSGERLYRAHGFELIGRGQTYWLHL